MGAVLTKTLYVARILPPLVYPRTFSFTILPSGEKHIGGDIELKKASHTSTNTSQPAFRSSSFIMEADSSVRSCAMCSSGTDQQHGDEALCPEDAAYELDTIEHRPNKLSAETSQHVHAVTKDG